MATPTKPNSRLGIYVLKTFKDESFRACVPPPLPPDPPLALQPLLPLLEQANQALGRLDGLASILPLGGSGPIPSPLWQDAVSGRRESQSAMAVRKHPPP
jgi:hypothetical protein